MTLHIPQLIFVLLIVALCSGCQKPPIPKATGDQLSFKKPSATDVFNLRTRCAELGEKINSEYDFAKVAIPFLTQEHASHYEPETNRCYVELHVGVNFASLLLLSKGNAKARKMNADFLEHYDLEFNERHLYDGQTGEELAFVQNGLKGVKATGVIKGRLVEAGNWADAANEIDSLMADDRKQ